MKSISRLLSFCAIALSLTVAPQNIFANTCGTEECDMNDNCYGCAYENCCRAPNVSPCLALGVVVAVGVVAALIVNGNSHSSSSHSSSSHS